MSKFLPIGERLREEREKLEFNQADFAAKGGCTRKTQYNYEAGERAPDGAYLAAIAAAGADVQYILTGIRSVALPGARVLRPDQAALLDNVEHCAKEDQEAIKRMAFIAAKADNTDEMQPGKKTS